MLVGICEKLALVSVTAAVVCRLIPIAFHCTTANGEHGPGRRTDDFFIRKIPSGPVSDSKKRPTFFTRRLDVEDATAVRKYPGFFQGFNKLAVRIRQHVSCSPYRLDVNNRIVRNGTDPVRSRGNAWWTQYHSMTRMHVSIVCERRKDGGTRGTRDFMPAILGRITCITETI